MSLNPLIGRIGGGVWRMAQTGKAWVLPNVCPACRNRVCAGKTAVCAECANRLRPLPGPRCPQCGGAVDGPLAVCGGCLSGDSPLWNRAVTVYGYAGFVRDLIHQLKYERGIFLVPFMAGRMVNSWRQYGGHEMPDVVTWVPMHWKRKIYRGYNQAELLARAIGHMLEIPAQKLVRRKKNSRKQATLGKVERNKNLTRAFAPRGKRGIVDRHILLIDDVFTTGATLRAVTKAIHTCTPAQISVLTLARG